MLKPYPSFNIIDDAGGLVLAAFILTIGLGLPGLLLLNTGPLATWIGIGLLIIPCLLLWVGGIILLGSFLKFVVGEAAHSIHEIRSERERHLRYLKIREKAERTARARQQQQQVIIEMGTREHAKRSHSDQVQ